MHPMFVTLFLEADADELLTEEQDRRRHVRQARRSRCAQSVRTGDPGRDRPQRPDR
jgi:hypothetical protein